MTNNVRTQTAMPLDQNAQSVQVLGGSGTRTNLTAPVASSAATALPAGGSGLFLFRAVDWVWLNFGVAGVAAAANATSILVPPGEGVYVTPVTATHYAVMRVGASDVLTQIEAIK